MLFFRTEDNRKLLENNEKAGKLLRLFPGCYSNDTLTEPASQIRSNIVQILKHLRPGTVISHRSALKNDFGAGDGVIVVTDQRASDNYVHRLPEMMVLATPGPGPYSGDADLGGIFVSSQGRAILENLEIHRPIKRLGGIFKQTERDDLMRFLRETAPDDTAMSGVMTLAKIVNTESGGRWTDEMVTFNKIAEERSRDDTGGHVHLTPDVDHYRVGQFERLVEQLLRKAHGNEKYHGNLLPDFPSRPTVGDNRFLNMAFFESYFSNYIEGTEFLPEDAYKIVTSKKDFDGQRIKDEHDIRSLYLLYASPEDFLRDDNTPDEFIENLKHWHAVFGGIAEKTNIMPGRFKDIANRAGSTWFASPHQVVGTLKAAWEIGLALKEPFDQAIFRAISTVSVHPFIDGNGRITRLAASNVLGRHGKHRLMIPNVFREDYILALRAFSGNDPVPAIRMFKRAMDLTISVPMEKDFPAVSRWLKDRNAYANPSEGKWTAETVQTPESPSRSRMRM